MSVKFANNAFGTLSAGITDTATSITLASGQGARFPTLASGEYFYATLIDTSNNLEVVKVTARSTDVLTATRGQEGTTAQAFTVGDRIELRVTAAGLTDAANPYDKDTSSTGSLALPVGTTAQQPTAADTEGHIRYDSDDEVIYYSNGTDWLKISSVIPILSSVTGNIYDGAASTLTLAGTGFLASNLTVTFFQAADSIDEDVVVTPTSDVAATVSVPAAVYNNVTNGNVVSVTVTNSDNISSAAVSKTAVGLPTGGTVTTSGATRIHTFTSSGNFVVPSGFSANADILLVAGGGGGGGGASNENDGGGGGGAGGMITLSSQSLTAQTYSITVGGGGSGGAVQNNGSTGSNTTGFGQTVNGGGYGGLPNTTGGNGGSGGGSGGGGSTSGNANSSGTSGQGNNGGGKISGYPYVGGGGGGKSQAGGHANYSGQNGYGGDGLAWNGTTYAGGGAGGHGTINGSHGTGDYSNPGAGGTGGGGEGGTYTTVATAGSTNLGGGGGGGKTKNNGVRSGGNGGSGVVIVRYTA